MIVILNKETTPRDGTPGSSQLLIARTLDNLLQNNAAKFKPKLSKSRNNAKMQRSNRKIKIRDDSGTRKRKKVNAGDRAANADGALKRKAPVSKDTYQKNKRYRKKDKRSLLSSSENEIKTKKSEDEV